VTGTAEKSEGKGRSGKSRPSVYGIAKRLFLKYQKDNGQIIVSSISFYVLLTFIPFTLLSIFILGYAVDLGNPAAHIEKYIKTIVPDPYHKTIIHRTVEELNIISLSKKLSGPLGLLFLFLFTTRLFTVIRSSFRIVFGGEPEKFLRGKEKEILFTLLFSLLQTIIFFSFILTLLIQTQLTKVLPPYMGKTTTMYLFALLDGLFTFAMFYFLYYFLTPARKNKKVLLSTTLGAVVLWHIGKYLFKYYILHVGKFTAFFGAYGVFIAFLLWVYFSVFVFVTSAELQSILLAKPSRGPAPSSCPPQETPEEAPTG
jgi:membrane protein